MGWPSIDRKWATCFTIIKFVSVGVKCYNSRMMQFKTKHQKLIERFKRHYVVDENGCHIWQSATRNGYGIFRRPGNLGTTGAHRAAYTIFVGEIPEGMLVCHKCDVKSCVNPEHLFIGTHTDNMRDMHRKGRRPPISTTPWKLDWEKARAIRFDPRPQEEIAKAYNVSRTTISKIKNNKVWTEERYLGIRKTHD